VLRGSVPCVTVAGCVVCKGAVPAAQADRAVLGRLPAEARPPKLLRFAARACHPADESGAFGCKLVTIECETNGDILIYSGVRRSDALRPGSTIDLSAVRFCAGNGINLIDDVLLYLCDVNGTRIVCLQGMVSERYFNAAARTSHPGCVANCSSTAYRSEYGTHGRTPLTLLPSSGQLARETYFVTAGGSEGGYHLLLVRPDGEGRVVGSGDIIWRDCSVHRDVIHLDGLMWEATPEALLVANPMSVSRANESQVILVMDFQRYLIRRFGSVQEAWDDAFDTDCSGSVNFTEFGIGCKAAGFVGDVTKLWAALDIDRSGVLSISELGADTEEMLRVARADRAQKMAELKAQEPQHAAAAAAARDIAVSRATFRLPAGSARRGPAGTPSPRVFPLEMLQRGMDRRKNTAAPSPAPKTIDFLSGAKGHDIGPPARPNNCFSARHKPWVGQPLARPQSSGR